MSRIYLDWNLGLGAAIICNGVVESVPTRGKLFFHRYAQPGAVQATLRKPWIMLD
jgi:hypothetical protein